MLNSVVINFPDDGPPHISYGDGPIAQSHLNFVNGWHELLPRTRLQSTEISFYCEGDRQRPAAAEVTLIFGPAPSFPDTDTLLGTILVSSGVCVLIVRKYRDRVLAIKENLPTPEEALNRFFVLGVSIAADDDVARLSAALEDRKALSKVWKARARLFQSYESSTLQPAFP